jgi:hypothetical protein
MSGSGRRRGSESSQQGGAPTQGKAKGWGGSGGEAGAFDPCEIEFDVDLSGVNVSVAAGLVVGTVLRVELTVINGFDVVVCRTTAGAVVGSLAAFPGLATLVGCMRGGRRYAATVTALNGTNVGVHVGLVP